MYVDSSALCNDLTFVIGTQSVSSMRQWEIKVSQYTCDFDNLAPSGCTQYFFSENGMGTFQTFNFDGGQHLANQRHKFCFRRERDMCRICFSQTANEDFETSGAAGATVPGTMSSCCGYGPMFDGETVGGNSAYDCLVIPHAETKAGGIGAHGGVSEYCGSGKKISTTAAAGFQTPQDPSGNAGVAATICSTRLPFE